MSSNVEVAPDLWTREPASRPDRVRIRARIAGMHCSLCTGTIEKVLGRHEGVDKVAVSLTHEQALVEYDPKRVQPDALLKTLRQMGYAISDPRKLQPFEEDERLLAQEGRRFLWATVFSLGSLTLIARPGDLWYAILESLVALSLLAFVFLVLRSSGLAKAVIGTAVAAIYAGTLFWLKQSGHLTGLDAWIAAGLAVSVVFFVGRQILIWAWHALRRGIINQHVLLEAAAFAGLGGGVYGLGWAGPEFPTAPFFCVAVMVCNYHIFSEWLSLIVKTRSSQAVRRLLALQPDTARVVRNGVESEIGIKDVVVGDLVRIRPGERIPVDGTITEGHSDVDQALVTGEPLPVERKAADPVIGGSMNGLGTLLIRVSAVGEESFLQRVAREVEDARALKPGMLHLVDRVLKVYAPTVLTLSALALIGWIVGPMLFGGAAPDYERAVFAGLTVLVMGYPCALGVSAPLSIVRGAGQAAERGILMRTGEAFQGYRLATHVVFDKTGTLTEGRPSLRAIEAAGESEETLVGIAAAAEAASEHPLARAVMAVALERRITPLELDSFEAVPGRGVRARLAGDEVLVGSPRFLTEQGVDLGQLHDRIRSFETGGHTVVAVARGSRALGLLAFGDQVRTGARSVISRLRGQGVRTLIVSGDNAAATQRVGAEVGIDEVHAELLPQDKARIIRELQRKGNVAMVGDGINDAPALMQANIGIAMGGGTDIAIDAADIIILNNRLEAVVDAREISGRSYRKMVQNVCLAVMFNGIGVPLAATGLVYPIWAMTAMAVSVTLIFVNSLRGKPRMFFDAILSVQNVAPNLKLSSASS